MNIKVTINQRKKRRYYKKWETILWAYSVPRAKWWDFFYEFGNRYDGNPAAMEWIRQHEDLMCEEPEEKETRRICIIPDETCA